MTERSAEQAPVQTRPDHQDTARIPLAERLQRRISASDDRRASSQAQKSSGRILPPPPPELTAALVRARRVRALFGSLHLRRRKQENVNDPEAPFDRLVAWRDLLPEPGEVPAAWTETRRHLVRLSSEAPAGGMVAD